MLISAITFKTPMAKTNSVSFKGEKYFSRSDYYSDDIFVQRYHESDKKAKVPSSDFISWAKRTDFIKTQLPEILNNEKTLLGSGYTHKVHVIPRNKKYLLRYDKSQKGCDAHIPLSEYRVESVADNNLDRNFGQPIARIMHPDAFPYYEIILKQRGITYSVPQKDVIYEEDGYLKDGEVELDDPQTIRQFENSLEALASFPPLSFEKLIKDLLFAQEKGYMFDYCNPNNFLLDEETKSINIIDLEKRRPEGKNELGNVLWALGSVEYMLMYLNYPERLVREENRQKTIENFCTILDKYMNAMSATDSKFDITNEYFAYILTTLPYSYYAQTADIEKKRNKLIEEDLLFD